MAKKDGVTEVAMKILKPEFAAQPSSKQAFLAEINLLHACRDASIVSMLGGWAHAVR